MAQNLRLQVTGYVPYRRNGAEAVAEMSSRRKLFRRGFGNTKSAAVLSRFINNARLAYLWVLEVDCSILRMGLRLCVQKLSNPQPSPAGIYVVLRGGLRHE